MLGRAVKLGPTTFGPGALLAPMEAVTDLPFRTVCEELGAVLTYTEFLSADALIRGAAKAVSRMWPSLAGRHFAVQIFGREPEVMVRAAEMAAESGASVLDINMGCPAKKVTSGLCGSALMREPELAASIVAAVRRSLPDSIPVTVKHRVGWDDASINAPEFAVRMVEAGAALVTVHGRTRAQGFSGSCRLEPIAAVRGALPRTIPVIGNGDVKTVADYLRMRVETAVDAVMVGRGAMGNPWLFRSLAAVARGHVDPGPPTLAERHATWRRHAGLVEQHAHPRMLVHELKKTVAWYSRGLFGGAHLRERCNASKDPQVVRAEAEDFFGRLQDLAAAGDERALLTSPADPTAKSVARHGRRAGAHAEALESPREEQVA
jgi:nifR3 family TIM-barrel protein